MGAILIFQRLSSGFAALLVSVFLFAFPLNGYSAIAEFKYGIFLFICGGYCAAVIIIRAQLALTGVQPIRKINIVGSIRSGPIAAKLLLLFLFFSVLSCVFSDYGGTFLGGFRREGALTIALYVLSCCFLSKYFRPQKWMLFLLGASTCLFCIIPLSQLTGANPFTLYPEGYGYYDAGVRYSGEYLGTIGNAGLCAGFISIVTGILAMSLIKFDFRKKRLLIIPLFLAVFLTFEMAVDAGIAALAAGMLIMIPVAVTDRTSLARTLAVFAVVIAAFAVSRAVIFSDGHVALAADRLIPLIAAGLAAALSAFVMKWRLIARIPARGYSIGSAAVVLLAICLAVLYLWFYRGESSGMIYEASEVLHGSWDDTFGSRRVYIWRSVLGRVSENLLFGTGPDTLGHWDIAPFTRYSEELGTTLTARIDAAHNEYLQILACTGLLSLLCYLGALMYTAVKWFRAPDNSLSAVAGTGVLFYCVQAFFGISMPITAPFFWAGLAVLVYSQNHTHN